MVAMRSLSLPCQCKLLLAKNCRILEAADKSEAYRLFQNLKQFCV